MATRPPQRPAASGLVYSTDAGRMCPDCREPVARCRCRAAAAGPAPSDGVVRVRRETSGRGGKTVTVVWGLAGDAAQLQQTSRQIKALCGSGGTLKEGRLEVQGDHVDRVIAWLQAQGLTVKRAGG